MDLLIYIYTLTHIYICGSCFCFSLFPIHTCIHSGFYLVSFYNMYNSWAWASASLPLTSIKFWYGLHASPLIFIKMYVCIYTFVPFIACIFTCFQYRIFANSSMPYHPIHVLICLFVCFVHASVFFLFHLYGCCFGMCISLFCLVWTMLLYIYVYMCCFPSFSCV